MRRYEETHPWITFSAVDVNQLGPRHWMLLGEAHSKCQHLAGTPLAPEVARRLYEVTLIKGARATAAIEGNTLSMEQVEGIYRGTYSAPPSRAYQEREIRNVLQALTEVDRQIMGFDHPKITPELIKQFNFKVLDGTEYEPHVVPGECREYPVGVPDYLGAPAEDCEHLLARLCDWLESATFQDGNPDEAFAWVIACAIYAHLYVAWIHPFGDGNGRTARLVEYLILARSGLVPLPAAHLLSNHYNLTRDQYFRELAHASRSGRVTNLIAYAVQGLVDGIREEIAQVNAHQMRVTWINYVHEVMSRFPSGPSRDRQRSLVLALPDGEWLPKSELPGLTSKLAAAYAKAGPRTLQRDLNRLNDVHLIERRGFRWRSNTETIRAFLPPIADPEFAAWLHE